MFVIFPASFLTLHVKTRPSGTASHPPAVGKLKGYRKKNVK